MKNIKELVEKMFNKHYGNIQITYMMELTLEEYKKDVLKLIDEYKKDMIVLEGDTELTFEEHINNLKQKIQG